MQITAGGNTNVTGSNVVGTHDVAISSGKDTSISSAQEYERHDYAKQVKKSGLLSGGGLGFTIGTEKRKDQYSDADLLQKSSTVGSVSGNVSIESGNKVEIGASAVLAGKDISITGENVQISSKDNVYHSEEKHEYKKSGLTVSANGGAADILTNTIDYAKKASNARDKQLKALYGAEVYQTIAKGKYVLKDLSGKGMPGVSVGIGTSSFKAETHTETIEAVGSNLLANNDIHITAKKDIEMKGSQVIGNNVSMNAGENITLNAAENRSTSDTKQSSKSSQAGMNFAPTGNSFYANASKGQGNETEETLIHTGSQVIARKDLMMESGEDTTLRGSNAYGDKVTMKVGGTLTIESVQDKDNYTSHNESKGMGLSTGTSKTTNGHGGLTVGTSKGNTDSTYESVTNQAGITASNQGYDISVKANTYLKGGLIDSNASKDKNTITTGTLTWEDVENKADYKATAYGRNYGASWSPKETITNKDGTTQKVGGNKVATSPVQSQPVKEKSDSTTKSAISEGTISITDKENQKQDISALNRDTKNTLNQLEKIFDKEKVQERQALANEFAKLGAEKIGDIAKEKNWSPNDPRRSLLHGLLGGISAKLGGNSILSGVASGATMEGLQPMLDTFLKDHPDMREEVSSIFGYCAGKLFGGDGDVGAATAWNGTKFNWLTHDQMDEYAEEMKQAKTEKEQETVIEKWLHINALQEDDWLAVQGNGSFTDLSGKKGVLVRDSPVTALGSTFDWKGSVATTIIGEEAGLPWILNEKYGSQGFIRALGEYNVVGVGISGALDLVGDYNNYSNDDFLKAIFIDTGKIGVGIALGMLVPVPGVLYAPIMDYGGYKFKTRYLKTNAQKFHESNMKSKKS